MKLKKSTLRLQLLLFLSFSFPALVQAQTYIAIGGYTQAARNGENFNWGGPTKTKVTTQFITNKNALNEEIGYYRRVTEQSWSISGTNFSDFEVKRNTSVSRNGGRLANTTGNSAGDYPFWIVYTFETPVPANEIFMLLHDADRAATNGMATGHIWINKNRNGSATPAGTAGNADFQRMKWNGSDRVSASINRSGEINWGLSPAANDANKYIALAGTTTRTVKRIVVETENIGDDIDFGLAWLKPVHLNTLPVVLHQFNALQLNSEKVRISWDVSESGNDVSHYEPERSNSVADNFNKLTSIPVSGLNRYQSLDTISGLTGVVYYRLKIVYTDSHFKYSTVVPVSLNSKPELLKILPNPATERLSVLLESPISGKMLLQLINAAGQPVLAQQETIVKGPNIFDLENLTRFAKGTYFLKITTANGQIAETKPVILQ